MRQFWQFAKLRISSKTQACCNERQSGVFPLNFCVHSNTNSIILRRNSFGVPIWIASNWVDFLSRTPINKCHTFHQGKKMKKVFLSLLTTMIVAVPSFAQDDEPAPSSPSLDGSESVVDSIDIDEVVIELTKSRRVTGELTSLTQFAIETKFGEANIPLAEVDGIKLHIDDNDSSVVALKNGDIITGKLKVENLAVTTDWGDANVKLASVRTILINQAGSFYQDASVGKNLWRFGDTKALAKSAAPTRAPQTQVRQNNNRFAPIQQPGNRFGR